ncbi:MAG: hypothetical protein K2I97_01470, partial [Alistipes sp.]|nr:hypothetical protein [Alistipes sp.]
MSNPKFGLLLVALCSIATLSAQDRIVKTDDTQIEARVLEISPEQIRYKRFSNPDGPTYVLPVGDIDHIRYANDEIESFRPAQPTPAPQPDDAVQPQPTADTPRPAVTEVPQQAAPAQHRQAQRPYEIGEWYDFNGVQGVVCVLDEDRMHGLILSLDEIYLHWSEYGKSDLRLVGADDTVDGETNMAKIAAYIAANGASWDDFPAFKWCRDKGEGWYLPAIDELLQIGHNFNGGTRTKFDRHARNKFNNTLKEHDGKRMDRLVYYFSSTERDEKTACTSHMDLQPP